MLRLERISKLYPNSEVLKDINWEIKSGDRIGLVGVNGAGKSTQLKIIAGIEEATTGQVVRQGNPRIAFLKQEFDVDPEHTVREELFQAFADAAKILLEQQSVELAMSSDMAKTDPDHLNNLIKKLGVLHTQFEALQGYEIEAQIEKILPTIGFESKDANELVGKFSGGWQMRIALGKILLQEPDLLLLDEPTNHLDIETIQWLEDYLVKQTAAIVVISHDRAFLDKICTQIVSTESGVSHTYLGNYTAHLAQKEIDKAANLSTFERQQKELATQQAYIDRFRASATRSTQAKSREKLLEKVELIEAPIGEISSPKFSFPAAPRSGRQVVLVNDLSHTFGEKILFLGANLEVEPGDKIAFIGPNGSGKSTLFRLILGIEEPDDGKAEIGKHNIFPGYFEQNQAEALDLEKTVINTMFEVVPNWTQTEVRSLLGSFCLSKEAVFKEVGLLSGGEKARLALALMLIKPCNLLILDEPTNHLDIPAKEMLEDALREYEGSALLISHDRYFISRVANRIVELKDGELVLYKGNYTYYKEKKEEEKKASLDAMVLAKKEAKRLLNRDRQRKRKAIKKTTGK
ncbi:ABC-F family ATP-binding cassette domain-containing protein [Prochlorococcus sp. MIT 1341]|uniref:ABC-F family ATP-binding cassette domain-containing protein n=1 Tax=Prochlorococcus sp. MIT 1341 TaxID=3096221 RepID=UPI002A74D05B|nr:ABC-F family ATP-binding cassette domain-containing protein [Prochlorococcus sp. MIT 1341]